MARGVSWRSLKSSTHCPVAQLFHLEKSEDVLAEGLARRCSGSSLHNSPNRGDSLEREDGRTDWDMPTRGTT